MERIQLQEGDSKLYLITTKDGKKKYTASLTDSEKAELVGKGAQVEDPATGANNTSSIMSEDFTPSISSGDVLNLAVQLKKAVEETLRAHGDEVSVVTSKFNKEYRNIVIYVSYVHDPDNSEIPDRDRFPFDVSEGVLKLVDNGDVTPLCPIDIKSGTPYFNTDLFKDALTHYLDKTKDFGNDGQEQQVNECGDVEILDEFRRAVQSYREKGRSKETIKELFKAARGFEGDDLQHKFRNAVNMYKSSLVPSEEEHVEDLTIGVDRCNKDTSLTIGYALLLKMFEWAKEDAEKDEDLHFAIEKIEQIGKEKGFATMDDFEYIIGKSELEGSSEAVQSYTEEPEKSEESLAENWFDPSDDEIEDMKSTGKVKNYPYTEFHTFLEDFNLSYKDFVKHADSILSVETKQKIMDQMSEDFDWADSLDYDILGYFNNTNDGSKSLKDVVDIMNSVMSDNDKWMFTEHLKDMYDEND